MSSERNTERLIDLMYGEATEQETKKLLGEIAESTELQHENEELQLLIGGVRELWEVEPAPASIHSHIMDAAKSALVERAEKRQPIPKVKSPGLWGRIKASGQIGQVALVATVLIVGAFVVRFVDLNETSTESFSANAPMLEVEETSKTEGGDKISVKENPIVAGSANKQNMAAKKTAATPIQKADSKEMKRATAVQARDRGAAGGKKIVKKTSKKKSSRSAKPKAAPQYNRGAKPKGSYRKNKVDDLLSGSLTDQKDKPNAPQNEIVLEKESKNMVAKNIDSVNKKYKKRDYAGTIQAADEFVSLKSGTRNERARALQLKAQSLQNLGRYEEALRVYDSILKNYKSYQSASISSARAEISRKLEERRPAKKKSRKSKKKGTNYDFSEDSVQNK